MSYKNSMKLLTSNFSFVWKQLAYTILRLAIILGLTVLVSRPIVDVLAQEGFVSSLKTLWGTVYTNTGEFFTALKDSIEIFVNTLWSNIGNLWIWVFLFLFVVVFLNSVLRYMGKYTLTYIAHNNFTSLNKCGYAHSFLSNFWKSLKYALCRLLLDLPFMAIKVAFIIAYCSALDNWLLAIIGISLLIILFTITYALQIAMYNNLAVKQITTGKNPFVKMFHTSSSVKDFFKVFSNAIVIVLTIIVANVVIGVFSFGAGLLITVPASMALVVIFELISYYTATKQRYYLSPTIIVDTLESNKIEKNFK